MQSDFSALSSFFLKSCYATSMLNRGTHADFLACPPPPTTHACVAYFSLFALICFKKGLLVLKDSRKAANERTNSTQLQLETKKVVRRENKQFFAENKRNSFQSNIRQLAAIMFLSEDHSLKEEQQHSHILSHLPLMIK